MKRTFNYPETMPNGTVTERLKLKYSVNTDLTPLDYRALIKYKRTVRDITHEVRSAALVVEMLSHANANLYAYMDGEITLTKFEKILDKLHDEVCDLTDEYWKEENNRAAIYFQIES